MPTHHYGVWKPGVKPGSHIYDKKTDTWHHHCFKGDPNCKHPADGPAKPAAKPTPPRVGAGASEASGSCQQPGAGQQWGAHGWQGANCGPIGFGTNQPWQF
eukprot:TRINITY_DN267_c0_g4_i1.p2 TRINITY_DN267_c0_g4~~TRINITY_DN267_c0_g4_i1.p2  ORF type:complete len:101 (+),score=12.87 TRINITY_DN267_c0_g4_i1:85-387(+)